MHAENVLVFFARRTLDPHLALDLTAETFARAYIRRRQFRGDTSEAAAGWLYRIAHNELARYQRDGQVARRAMERLRLREPTYGDGDISRVQELAGLSHLRGEVAERFAALPDRQREAVELRVIDELGYPEVAARLGISEESARARVSRGLRLLRAVLTDPQREGLT